MRMEVLRLWIYICGCCWCLTVKVNTEFLTALKRKKQRLEKDNTSAVTWGSLKTRVFFFFFFLIILAFLFFYWDHVCLLYIMCQIMYKKIDKMNQENTKTMTFSVTMSRVRTL